MRLGRFVALVVGWGAVFSAGGAAQGRAAVGAGLVAIGSDPAAIGVLGRARWYLAREVGLATGAGVVHSGGALAVGEFALQFRFGPGSGRGPKPVWYVAGGLAVVTGPRRAGRLLAGVGAEWPTGRAGSWWTEVGVAGGVRVAGGYQVEVGGRKR